MKPYQERVAERLKIIRESPYIVKDWEREGQLTDILQAEMYGPEAVRAAKRERHAEAVRKFGGEGCDVTVEVRSLYSPDWSDNHEA